MSIIHPSGKEWQQFYRATRPRSVARPSWPWSVTGETPVPRPESGLRKRLPVWTVAVLLAFFTVFPLTAQLQQSGGGGSNASVGATGATAPTNATLAGGSYNSSLPTLSTGQMGPLQVDTNGRLLVSSIANALPSGANVIGNVGQNGAWTMGLSTGSNVIGYVRTAPLTSCGTVVYDSGITVLPNSSTAATTTSTCVTSIYLSNTTGSAVAVTVTDNQGTPSVYVGTFSLPAYSSLLLPFGGIKFSNGIKWYAGTASSVNGQVLGYQ